MKFYRPTVPLPTKRTFVQYILPTLPMDANNTKNENIKLTIAYKNEENIYQGKIHLVLWLQHFNMRND